MLTPHQAAFAALAALTWLVCRIQRANALATPRKISCWLALGSAQAALLAYLVDPGSLVGVPLSLMVLLFWAAPGIALLTSRSQQLMTRLEHALNRGDLPAAEGLLSGATEAVNDSSAVDIDWNRAQLGKLEGRLRLAQGRVVDAIAPLERGYTLARDLGVPVHVAEAGELLFQCYCATRQWDAAERLGEQLPNLARVQDLRNLATALSRDSQAMHASDSDASVPALPADTTSPKILSDR